MKNYFVLGLLIGSIAQTLYCAQGRSSSQEQNDQLRAQITQDAYNERQKVAKVTGAIGGVGTAFLCTLVTHGLRERSVAAVVDNRRLIIGLGLLAGSRLLYNDCARGNKDAEKTYYKYLAGATVVYLGLKQVL